MEIQEKKAPVAPDLHEYLNNNRIIIRNTARKEDVLNDLVESMRDANTVMDIDALRAGIFKREKLMSTGIGLGIAIPHVRLDSVSGLTMSVMVVRNGIPDYLSLDDIPVRLVFLLAAHSDQHAEYLRVLSRLSAILKDEDFREHLISLPDARSLFKNLEDSVIDRGPE
ncbi:MAG: PTS sugar transporter subunit IIA [Spirochaetales bacterium]|nr:PTS sugar transporter subunit IIA [Spirochaetales bacterium]MCF7938238.1 PTS sugar transporter subunit IIA [Spirochaetales bacterium]